MMAIIISALCIIGWLLVFCSSWRSARRQLGQMIFWGSYSPGKQARMF